MNMSRHWNVLRAFLPLLLILLSGASLGMGAPASYAQIGSATATPEPTATATPEPTPTATPELTATATPEPTTTPNATHASSSPTVLR